MLKIIEPGDISKTDPIYRGTCRSCECKVECNKSDLQSRWLSRDNNGQMFYIICPIPTCGHEIVMSKKV